MAYNEEQSTSSRVVVETPTNRREVVHSEAVRTPERDGLSAGTVGIIVVLAVALITVLVLLFMSSQPQDTTNSDLAAQQPPPQTTIVQQPAQQQPPVVIQQPAPPTQQAPIIINQPASGGAASGATTSDAVIQAEVDKRIADNPDLAGLGIVASVVNGKLTLMGTVKSDALKLQVEKTARTVGGIKEIDNQIIVG